MLITLNWSSHAVIFLTTVLCQHHLATCWLLSAKPAKDIKILKYSPSTSPIYPLCQKHSLGGLENILHCLEQESTANLYLSQQGAAVSSW